MVRLQTPTSRHLICAQFQDSGLRPLPSIPQQSVFRKTSPHFVRNLHRLRTTRLPLSTTDHCPSKINRYFYLSQDLLHLITSHYRLREETATHQILPASLPFPTLAQEVAHSTATPFHPMAEIPSFQRLPCQSMTTLTENQARLCPLSY
jgi:hypothetical protein